MQGGRARRRHAPLLATAARPWEFLLEDAGAIDVASAGLYGALLGAPCYGAGLLVTPATWSLVAHTAPSEGAEKVVHPRP
jgi:hypothetical protein